MLVADCPRCGTKKITFNIKGEELIRREHGWQCWYETFCICRSCNRATVFLLSQNNIDGGIILNSGLLKIAGAVNRYMKIEGYVSAKDESSIDPPKHLPEDIEKIFKEGASCLSIQCYNAAATMFRSCLDLATGALVPSENSDDLNNKTRRDLGPRLIWLFKKGLLPSDLEELSACIKDDGNDGAHRGTLKKEDAEDLLDFTHTLLQRLYSEPKKLENAKNRRLERRAKTHN